LSVLGIDFDDGFMISTVLDRLAEGQEAAAWLDRDEDCVYKLFDLKAHGALGKKLVFSPDGSFQTRVRHSDAYIWDTLEKLCILHEAGGCPTEIVGLSESGDYLVAKQLRCFPYGPSLEDDRRIAVEALHAVVPTGSYGERIWVFWCANQGWVLGDLHKGNIRRDSTETPTIIDALIGPIPVSILKSSASLQRSVERARRWSESGQLLSDDPFGGIDDDDL
jgi:hypothetical protein